MSPAPPEETHPPLRRAHYEVRRREDGSPWLLGVGGMGMTYLAHDPRLRLDVALKVIHPSQVAHPEARLLFQREARAAARVIHPNVAAVVYLHDDPAEFFYAMEFVDGVSLHDWLQSRGPLDTSLALALAAQVARGLAAIHEQGIVHRDLKPANVMVVEFPPGHPRHAALAAAGGRLLKIIDFGLARASGPAEAGGPAPTIGFRGTAAYASPEQCEEDPDLDGRADLYALGCILWEMLAAAPPFAARSHRELLNLQVVAPPPFERLVGQPVAVIEALRRALAKDRAERFPDGLAFAAVLDECRRQPGAPLTEAALAPAVAPSEPSRPATTVIVLPARFPWLRAILLMLAAAAVAWLLARRPGWRGETGPPPAAARLPSAKAVAVLPFANLSSDPADAYFATGIHEDVLTALAKLRDLRVSPRSAVMRHDPATPRDLPRLAAELGVSWLLEGSVRRAGGRVRVTAQLVSAADGLPRWAESYDREESDIFEIQAQVAAEIVRALAATLTPEEQRGIASRPTGNAAAYDAFLRGCAVEEGRGTFRDGRAEALRHFERAVALDGNFGLALAGVARSQAMIYNYGWDRTPAQAIRARAAAEAAVRLHPELSETVAARAEYLFRVEHEPAAALRDLLVVERADPEDFRTLVTIGNVLRRMDRWDEAVDYFQRAARAAPESGEPPGFLTSTFRNLRRWEDAWHAWEVVIARQQSPDLSLLDARFRMLRTGEWSPYVEALRQLDGSLSPGVRWRTRWLRRDFAGALETLRALPDETVAVEDPRADIPKALKVGEALRRLGRAEEARVEFEAAAAWLEKAAQERPRDALPRVFLARARAFLGDPSGVIRHGKEAMRLLPESRDAYDGRSITHEFALACAEAGEPVRASELLAQLLRVPSQVNLTELRNLPIYDVLRGHPDFEALPGAGH